MLRTDKGAVVILNWNGLDMLRRFLPSVVQGSAADGLVVVADNGSTDGSLAMLASEFPTVERLPLDRNYGFAEGYNRALAQIDAPYYLLLNSDVHVHAITGSTGAGVKPSPSSHFSWRNDNVSIYKPFKHQHLAEIRQTLTSMQTSFSSKIEFIPVRGCFSRGIFASAYLDCPVALDEIVKLYEDYYDDHNFTYVINRMPDLKDVVNTNKCLLYLTKEDGKLLIVSVIDNLLKGASGQAVHNMNLLFGLHERTGLNLKASAF